MGKGGTTKQVVREIHRRTRRRFSAEENVVLAVKTTATHRLRHLRDW